jgi:hypothetical protein
MYLLFVHEFGLQQFSYSKSVPFVPLTVEKNSNSVIDMLLEANSNE